MTAEAHHLDRPAGAGCRLNFATVYRETARSPLVICGYTRRETCIFVEGFADGSFAGWDFERSTFTYFGRSVFVYVGWGIFSCLRGEHLRLLWEVSRVPTSEARRPPEHRVHQAGCIATRSSGQGIANTNTPDDEVSAATVRELNRWAYYMKDDRGRCPPRGDAELSGVFPHRHQKPTTKLFGGREDDDNSDYLFRRPWGCRKNNSGDLCPARR